MELTLEQALQKGIEAHKAGQFQDADRYYTAILKANPKHPDANHNMGVLAVGVGKVETALPFFKTALEVNPNIAQFWLSYVDALIKLDRIEQAESVLDQAKSKGTKGDGFDQVEKRLASYNSQKSKVQEPSQEQLQRLVNLYTQGQYKETLSKSFQLLEQYSNSINLYNIIGAANNSLGKLDEAIEAYTKALVIKPDYAKAYNNIGNALKDQGKLDEAIDAFNKALSIKHNYAIAHKNLSSIKKYKEDNDQIVQVQELYQQEDLSEEDKCNLSFALAKMYEDIGKLDQSYCHLSEGNTLRKKLLKYSISQDHELFAKLKNTQPLFLKNSLEINEKSIKTTPIFILGMPRSGTTLIEQIISSHSQVTGAGELSCVSKFGFKLATGSAPITAAAVFEFRESYLTELSNASNGRYFVTDKMPQNFRFIPLICAAFPEAKIIHVQRNAIATCWSNYKRYFEASSLGYCYDLKDVVEYYKLYENLMKLWQSQYNYKIYNINYEKLTTDQENQTKKLINHLELTWEDACLSPQNNKRSVRTASQQQVRQKVYQGSSEAWRKYEPYLNGAFDSLPP